MMNPGNARPLKGHVDDGFVVGDGRRVAHGDLFARIGGVGFQDDDGLVDSRRGLDKTVSPRDAFQVHADDLGIRVPAEILQKVHFVQIQFVADAGKLGHADVFISHQVPEHQAHAAALGDDGQPSLGWTEGRDKGKAQAVGRVGHRDPVGSDKPDAVLPRLLQYPIGKLLSFFAQFVESAGGNSHPFYSGLAAGLDGIGDEARGNQHKSEIRHGRQFADVLVHLDAVHVQFACAGVDAEDASQISPANQIFQHKTGNVVGP